jgi:hypothetical protein
MKALLKITIMVLVALMFNNLAFAQTEKETKKELTSKSIKQARKQAKTLSKEGFHVARGGMPLDKQLEDAWMMQLQKDETGYPKYIVESGNSVAESQTAAKIQATETAKLAIAGAICTEIAALIETNIANQQLNNEDAASVTKTVAAAKNLVAQELGRTILLVEIYRTVGKNTESNIRLAYDFKTAHEIGKKVIRQKLEDETKVLQDKLDKLMDIK